MDQEDFTTLSAYVETWATAQGQATYASIRAMLERIEAANGLTRYFLYLRWRDRDAPPPGLVGSGDWPPQETTTLERHTTPWTYDEVMDEIAKFTANPFEVQVTRDRSGTVGWYDVDTFFYR